MAEKKKVLAREYFESIEVEDPDTEDEWTQIGGVNELTVSYDSDSAEVTDFDSEGFSENLTTERSVSFQVSGFRIVDPETGDVDPGQKIVDDIADKVGYEALVDVRINMIGGQTMKFTANLEPDDQGGGTNDPASWGATFNSFGKPEIESGT